jgi:hypothetical protein
MKIYLVKRSCDDDQVPYDQYSGAVVVAISPEHALELLHEKHFWQTDPWGNWDVTISEVDSKTPGIVLEDYKAG